MRFSQQAKLKDPETKSVRSTGNCSTFKPIQTVTSSGRLPGSAPVQITVVSQPDQAEPAGRSRSACAHAHSLCPTPPPTPARARNAPAAVEVTSLPPLLWASQVPSPPCGAHLHRGSPPHSPQATLVCSPSKVSSNAPSQGLHPSFPSAVNTLTSATCMDHSLISSSLCSNVAGSERGLSRQQL